MRKLRLFALSCMLIAGAAYFAIPGKTHAKTNSAPAPAAITGTSSMLPPPVCPPFNCPKS